MWELDCEESWVQKNWCFWTVVLEKTLESPLDCNEIQPVHPKGDQSWELIGRTDVEAETPILWPPDAKNRLIWKNPDAGKNWGQEEKGTTEDEMVGWHHQLLEFTQIHVHWVGDAIQPSHSLLSSFLLPPIPPSIWVFSNESTLCMRCPKYWSFSLNISPSNEHRGLVSFRMDSLDVLAV